jgi:predicted dehydrogenase
MADLVRLGIVGAGGIANYHHIPNLLKHPRAQITAVCDVNAEAATETAQRHDIAYIYTDYRAMLDEAPLDALVVCTSNDQHAPVSLAAIAKHLHVLCEKPLALNAAEARELAISAERAGVTTGVNFSYRTNPAVRFIKEIIESGDLGAIYQVSFQYLQGYNADPEVLVRPGSAWRMQKAIAGLGVLGDLGSHLIDLARFWFGEIASVQSSQRTFVQQRPLHSGGTIEVDGDDVTMALLDFRNGTLGTLQTSWSAPPWANHQRVEIYGSKGAIVYENENQQSIQAVFGGAAAFKYRAMAPVEVPARFHDTTVTHPAGFVDAVLKGERYRPSFLDGVRCQEVLDAIASAAIDGGRRAIE